MSHNLSNKAYENKVKYNVEYAKNNYKRVPLDLKIDIYEQFKAAPEKPNFEGNALIKTAKQQPNNPYTHW